jgi:hypothetical protein
MLVALVVRVGIGFPAFCRFCSRGSVPADALLLSAREDEKSRSRGFALHSPSLLVMESEYVETSALRHI